MDRRGFLQSLMIGASALAVDPEQLLWRPGAKKIFIPPLRGLEPLQLGQLIGVTYYGGYGGKFYDQQFRVTRITYEFDKTVLVRGIELVDDWPTEIEFTLPAS